MSVEVALSEWRRTRQLVSDDKEANLDAWEVELDAHLAELGFSYADLTAHLGESPHGWIEGEYEAFLEELGAVESEGAPKWVPSDGTVQALSMRAVRSPLPLGAPDHGAITR